ncbi:MAG: 7-cyano-7-deazaguanine synthase QueC [Gammaproteobacteria bacterium CG22_combo_CG10-13_8_21_14_all_40_8]|nr:MAG: 7-cyano-7-deazaguanine synthase QueC [Gammaproteobacteria bacterium CG22_combo_CG10-13_8_21_14_all_40_8]
MNNVENSPPKAVVLLSGGLDSATALAIAKKQGFDCHTLSFNYGQRSHAELLSAKIVSEHFEVAHHKILNFDLGVFGGSALTDKNILVPEGHSEGIPVTYVPARNTIFLSLALGWAEVLGARHIFVGVNSVDYSGYPDCRPAFVSAFETLANLATKAGVEGHKFHIEAPLIHLTKAQIIALGTELGVPYHATLSCYQANEEGLACGHCDSCGLRKQGFSEAKVVDPTRYVE